MRLFLVRHGETEHNRRGLALGREDVPLNEHGRWQVERLAHALAHEPLAAVYSSPLSRALDTARAIARPHGLPVQIEPRFIEMDIGQAEGLTFAQVRTRYPGLLEAWLSAEGPAQPMPGGERLVDVQARAWEALEELVARHPQEDVVTVTHHFVILSILTRVLGMDLADFRRIRHSVAAISILNIQGDRRRLVLLNSTCHLEEG